MSSLNDNDDNSNRLKSLNLILKKNDSNTGYKVITPSLILNKNRESSVSPPSLSLTSNTTTNSIWSAATKTDDKDATIDSQTIKKEIEKDATSVNQNSSFLKTTSISPDAEASTQPSSSDSFLHDELSLINNEKPIASITSTKTESIDLDENNNCNNNLEKCDIFCEFCSKSGQSEDFHGRFCSKKCVIRFAQR